LAGWAAFYKLTDFTTRVFRHIDHVVFWKDGALVGPEIPQYHQVIDAKVVSGSETGKAKTWIVYGINERGNRVGKELRRMVSSPKALFRWRMAMAQA